MKIKALFVKYPSSYLGEFLASLAEAVDEYTDDDNPAWFEGKLAEVKQQVAKGDLEDYAIITFDLPYSAIEEAFHPKHVEVTGIHPEKG